MNAKNRDKVSHFRQQAARAFVVGNRPLVDKTGRRPSRTLPNSPPGLLPSPGGRARTGKDSSPTPPTLSPRHLSVHSVHRAARSTPHNPAGQRLHLTAAATPCRPERHAPFPSPRAHCTDAAITLPLPAAPGQNLVRPDAPATGLRPVATGLSRENSSLSPVPRPTVRAPTFRMTVPRFPTAAFPRLSPAQPHAAALKIPDSPETRNRHPAPGHAPADMQKAATRRLSTRLRPYAVSNEKVKLTARCDRRNTSCLKSYILMR